MIIQNNYSLIIKLILIILLQNFQFTQTEYFSSVHSMSSLIEFEGNFLDLLQNFVSKNENKLDYLKARLAEFERERDEAIVSGPAYFDSPVNQYLLTKRLTVDWERIKNLMETKTGQKTLHRFKKILHGNNITYEEELNGGIAGILNMQETYRMKTKDMANGILQGVSYNKQFDARLCFDIGVHAIELKKYRFAYFWLMEAMSRLTNIEDKYNIIQQPEKAHILTALANVKTKLGDIRGANETYAELLELKPDSEVLARTYMLFTMEHGDKNSTEIDYSEEYKPIPDWNTEMKQHERWMLTCSGHFKKTPREQRYLRCGYLTETHPFLTIAPIKVEELNHNPLLVQYYDVLYESEIEVMKELTNHRIRRATVMAKNGSLVSPVRTSQFLFLGKQKHKVLQIVDQRVQDMTNLDMNNAEEHQFQNYGIGGLYAEHYDYFNKEQLKRPNMVRMGNRIATLLFYLTDVEQGGGTAFPFLKQMLLPKKGAAVFWHNLHASEEPDTRTLHGGCPIIVGSKWVLNRWIRSRNQDKTRPCDVFNDVILEQIDK